MQRLRERLHNAKALCDGAFCSFEDALKPNGSLPHLDGSFRITKASQEYRRSLLEVNKAASELSAYLIRGTVPPEDDPKE